MKGAKFFDKSKRRFVTAPDYNLRPLAEMNREMNEIEAECGRLIPEMRARNIDTAEINQLIIEVKKIRNELDIPEREKTIEFELDNMTVLPPEEVNLMKAMDDQLDRVKTELTMIQVQIMRTPKPR